MENACAVKLNENTGYKIVRIHYSHNCIQRKLNETQKIRKEKNKMPTEIVFG